LFLSLLQQLTCAVAEMFNAILNYLDDDAMSPTFSGGSISSMPMSPLSDDDGDEGFTQGFEAASAAAEQALETARARVEAGETRQLRSGVAAARMVGQSRWASIQSKVYASLGGVLGAIVLELIRCGCRREREAMLSAQVLTMDEGLAKGVLFEGKKGIKTGMLFIDSLLFSSSRGSELACARSVAGAAHLDEQKMIEASRAMRNVFRRSSFVRPPAFSPVACLV
jgi:hypothetical protein